MNQPVPQEQSMAPEILTEKELHCIARTFQGLVFMDDVHWACQGNCPYAQECSDEFMTQNHHFFSTVRDRLTEVTGVYLGILINRFEAEENAVSRHRYHSP